MCFMKLCCSIARRYGDSREDKTRRKRAALAQGLPFIGCQSAFGDTRNGGAALTQDDSVHTAFEAREVQVFALCANTQFTQLVEAHAC